LRPCIPVRIQPRGQVFVAAPGASPVHQLVEFSDAQLRFSASVVARSEVVPRSCVDPVESSPGPVLAPTLRFFVRHWCSFLPPACNVSSSAPKHTVVSDFPARRLWHAACFSLGQMVRGCLHVSCSSVLLARFSVCLIPSFVSSDLVRLL
jgi:hypothetical protein